MNTPTWLDDAVVYEIYPQSFCDSNGDGIGDLPGIIGKLDYIMSLGVNAIWLNPCFESPFQDAGYDITDFYKVAPRYGTNADLQQLFDEAHKRGMKVLLDLVAGHSSVECEWFKKSCEPTPNEYSNYYIWTDGWGQKTGNYRFISGYANRDGNFMINFFYCQPALNYGFTDPDPEMPWQLPVDHPDVIKVREELRNIMKFYLDMGCDGFRVDMASSLVRGEANRMKGLTDLWQDYRKWMKTNYPEAILVSEWSAPDKAITAGFDIDFMVHFGHPGYSRLFRLESYRVPNSGLTQGADESSYFDKEGKGDAKVFIDELNRVLGETTGKGFVSVPTGNHDIGRIRQGRSLDELKALYTFLFTLPGVPFIYYGDEIGMDFVNGLGNVEGSYNRSGARTPMQWNDSPGAGFSTASEDKFYLPLDPSPDRPDVAAQEKDAASLLHFTRQLIKLRRETTALASTGKFKPLYARENTYPLVYERSNECSRYIIAVNPSGMSAEAQLKFPGGKVLLKHGDIDLNGHRIIMGPASALVYLTAE